MKTLVLGVSFLVLVCSTGCATILKPKLESVTMQSTPNGAGVWLDGEFLGKTPLTVELKPGSKPVILTLRKPGYADQRVRLTSSIGVHWVVADIFLGLAPVAIDAVSGDWYQFDKKLVTTSLQRRKGALPQDEEVAEDAAADEQDTLEVAEEDEVVESAPPPAPRRMARKVRRTASTR